MPRLCITVFSIVLLLFISVNYKLSLTCVLVVAYKDSLMAQWLVHPVSQSCLSTNIDINQCVKFANGSQICLFFFVFF